LFIRSIVRKREWESTYKKGQRRRRRRRTKTETTTIATGKVRLFHSFNSSKERESVCVTGNELPTSITDTNTYQKIHRRRRR